MPQISLARKGSIQKIIVPGILFVVTGTMMTKNIFKMAVAKAPVAIAVYLDGHARLAAEEASMTATTPIKGIERPLPFVVMGRD